MAIPSEAHFKAFGALIHNYASVETGFKIVLSGILNAPLRLMLIMSEPYSSLNLRQVVKAVAKEHDWPDNQLETLMQIIGDVKPIAPLRNHIAHCRWTEGTRADTIKPRRIDIREERARYYGNDEEERDWTASEIEAEAQKLIDINLRLIQFLSDTGLKEVIERNISDISPLRPG